jgi:hypothetical protein
MGLDMFLYKKSWVPYNKRNEVKIVGLPRVKNERIKEVTEEVGYWRKANHIHKWFVDNVQNGDDDCKEYYVEKEQLQELLGIVTSILNDKKLANRLLPTQSGFFFGGTDYDNYYFEDLQNTKEILENVLSEVEEEGTFADFYYRSSW